jgi:hypothetical protein
LISACFIGILIVAKHYHKNHYLFPILALSGAILFFSVEILKSLFNKKRFEIWIYSSFFLVFFVVFILNFLPLLQLKYYGYVDTNRQLDEVTNIINTRYRNYTQIYRYPDGINKFSALNFGNGYSKLNNQEALSAIYPNAYFYNFLDNRFQLWQYKISFKQIFGKHGLDIIITGSPMSTNDILALNNRGIYVNNIFISQFQAIYELDTTNTSQELKKIATIGKKEILCNAEILTENRLSFHAGNYLVSHGWLQSDELARSGKYSIKMSPDIEYALKVEINELYPGQDVECCVWRYFKDNEESYLIASADDPGIFYEGTNEVAELDNQDWEKLCLKFSIPDRDPPLEKVSFYVWNKGKGEVYFDDLRITLD